jgi:hypothetical protein
MLPRQGIINWIEYSNDMCIGGHLFKALPVRIPASILSWVIYWLDTLSRVIVKGEWPTTFIFWVATSLQGWDAISWLMGAPSTPPPGANGILKGEGKYNILKDIFHIVQKYSVTTNWSSRKGSICNCAQSFVAWKTFCKNCFYGPEKKDMQQEAFLLVELSHPKIFCPYFVMLPRIKVVPFLWNQWIWGSSCIDCSKEWRTMRPFIPHLSFLKQVTSCCKIAYIKTVWFIDFRSWWQAIVHQGLKWC